MLEIEEDQSDMNEIAKENENSDLNSKMVDHYIIQLSNNFIPKGLVSLEKLFDQNDVPRNPLSILAKDDIEESNIGIYEDIKLKFVHPYLLKLKLNI